MTPRTSVTLLTAILMGAGLSGCTMFKPGPCQPAQATVPRAFFTFAVTADESRLEAFFNETGWIVKDATPSGFSAQREWNESLTLRAAVGVGNSVGVAISGGHPVLTSGAAKANLSEPATKTAAELARFLGAPPSAIAYDGGTTHCGAT